MYNGTFSTIDVPLFVKESTPPSCLSYFSICNKIFNDFRDSFIVRRWYRVMPMTQVPETSADFLKPIFAADF